MCVVSNIGDEWTRRWPDNPSNPWKYVPLPNNVGSITREEFEALKKEIKALKNLLKAAKKYDEETGQPDCHMDDKVALIKKIADLVGVDLKEIF